MNMPPIPFTIIRDFGFKFLDDILPSHFKAAPYEKAFSSLHSLLPSDVQIWTRNSYKLGNYIFGVSDLDVTLYLEKIDKNSLRKIKLIIEDHKKLYPFLGEVNFYYPEISQDFVSSFNHFERQRDPILSLKLPETSYDLRVEKIVFLLRMLYADHFKIKYYPSLRQKKWKEHFRVTGGPELDLVTKPEVDRYLFDLIGVGDIQKSMEILDDRELTNTMVFNSGVPESWKFLFPHKYLWFDRGRLEEFSLAEIEIFASICIRQVEWEIWGISSQLPYLNQNSLGLLTHLRRMRRVVELLDPTKEIARKIDKLIEYSKKV